MAKVFLADKNTQDKIYNIVKDDGIYGFIEHMAESNPTKKIEYIGVNKDFTPLTQDLSFGKVDYGSWENFPILAGNKPWMVFENGVGDYRLKEDDYTKKLDGSASDVSNARYKGGAYAWLPRVYTRQEVYGEDRYVWFSLKKRDGFESVGFREWNGSTFDEAKGVWLPMFYGSRLTTSVLDVYMSKAADTDPASVFLTSIAGQAPFVGNPKTRESHLVGAVKFWKSDEMLSGYRILQGSILNVITDLLILFAKTTDVKSVFGKGRQNIGSEQAKNEVVNGGQFKGTSDGNTLNKIFHSLVLGSYQQAQLDATMYVSNDPYYDVPNLFVCKENALLSSGDRSTRDYTQVATLKSMADGTWKGTNTSRVKEGYGAVPVALHDELIGDIRLKAVENGVCLRLAPGENAGFRTYDLATAQRNNGLDGVGASTMLMPPIGLTP